MSPEEALRQAAEEAMRKAELRWDAMLRAFGPAPEDDALKGYEDAPHVERQRGRNRNWAWWKRVSGR